jgi:replicative DNA helicase
MIENIIFSNLVYNHEYNKKIFPFLKEEYFTSFPTRKTFELISDYVKKYSSFPSKEALLVDLKNSTEINEDNFKKTTEFISFLKREENEISWLIDKTEEFCKEMALHNAMTKAIKIINKKDQEKELTKGIIPHLLTEALSVSFDTHIGHEYLHDVEKRFDRYSRQDKRIKFDLEILNEITNGGIPPKTLNIIMGGTYVGKSLLLCSLAASNLIRGYNVLYITLELDELAVAERIDANLLDIPILDLTFIPKDKYIKKIKDLYTATAGKLFIKEYPTACASVTNFRELLNELKIKKKFVPDIIYIDYLNICCSSRVKFSPSVNSYVYVKAIGEELRGLAVEYELPVMTATQINRQGYTSSDPGLENISESWGIAALADFFITLQSSDNLRKMNQMTVRQNKNRYADINMNVRFVIGVDRTKMRVYDLEKSAQTLVSDIPVFDQLSSFKKLL